MQQGGVALVKEDVRDDLKDEGTLSGGPSSRSPPPPKKKGRTQSDAARENASLIPAAPTPNFNVGLFLLAPLSPEALASGQAKETRALASWQRATQLQLEGRRSSRVGHVRLGTQQNKMGFRGCLSAEKCRGGGGNPPGLTFSSAASAHVKRAPLRLQVAGRRRGEGLLCAETSCRPLILRVCVLHPGNTPTGY